MKKALALTTDRNFSCTLSHKNDKFACDVRAYADYLKSQGYEVWIHNPYVAKAKTGNINYVPRNRVIDNDWIEANGINGFDLVFTRISIPFIKALTGRINWDIRHAGEVAIKAMANWKGQEPIRNTCVDLREECRHPEQTHPVWKVTKPERCKTEYYDIIKSMVADGRIVASLPAEPVKGFNPYNNKEYVVDPDWSDYVALNLRDNKEFTYNPNNKEYDFVYLGSCKVKESRKESFGRLLSGRNCAVAGKVKFGGWPSLTNHKNTFKTEELKEIMSKSKLALVVAEPWHNFLTLRFFESFVSGAVMVVDSKYTVAADKMREIGLGDRVVATSEDVDKIMAKDMAKLYREQITAYFNLVNYYSIMVEDNPVGEYIVPLTKYFLDKTYKAPDKPVLLVVDCRVALYRMLPMFNLVSDTIDAEQMWQYYLNALPAMIHPTLLNHSHPVEVLVVDDWRCGRNYNYWREDWLKSNYSEGLEYKGNRNTRSDSDRPDGYNDLLRGCHDYCDRMGIKLYREEGFEADCWSGEVYRQAYGSYQTILVSVDNDWLQLVSRPEDKDILMYVNGNFKIPISQIRGVDEAIEYYRVRENYIMEDSYEIVDYKVKYGDAGDNIAEGTPREVIDLREPPVKPNQVTQYDIFNSIHYRPNVGIGMDTLKAIKKARWLTMMP